MTEHVASYYASTANAFAPYPALSENIRCDVCIVGGGFTGLSSALHLVEAGYDVVVLEAARIGWGASGRNGGQVVNSYSRDIDVIEARYGADTAAMLGGMMFEGAEIIRNRIDHYAIACDYRPGGIFAALNPKQLRTLEHQQANWRRYGNARLELLDQQAVRREIASERYVGGCWTATAATCTRSIWHWAKLTRYAVTVGGCTNSRRPHASSTVNRPGCTPHRGRSPPVL
ncbi:Gamma-glutamylputrescine oxidoreductase [Serratia plymuthica]|nr:Gamma-glutamylputrescine oxidoreductase [Serratia plymuthica]